MKKYLKKQKVNLIRIPYQMTRWNSSPQIFGAQHCSLQTFRFTDIPSHDHRMTTATINTLQRLPTRIIAQLIKACRWISYVWSRLAEEIADSRGNHAKVGNIYKIKNVSFSLYVHNFKPDFQNLDFLKIFIERFVVKCRIL